MTTRTRLNDEQIERVIAYARTYENDEPGAYDKLDDIDVRNELVQAVLQLHADLNSAEGFIRYLNWRAP